MKTLLSLLLVFITVTHAEDRFFDTSYDCTKTTERSVERSVCTDEHLAKLDKELSSIYSSFYYVTKEIKSDQRGWMKQKNRCKDTACIQKAYESRIRQLSSSLNNQKTFSHYALNFFNQDGYIKVMDFKHRIDNKIYWQNELDKNNSKRTEFEHGKDKYGDFCNEFYDDLFKFENIKVAEHPVQNIESNSTNLQKYMGEACYEVFNNELFKQIDVNEFSLFYANFNKDANRTLILYYNDRYNRGNTLFDFLDTNLCQAALNTKKYVSSTHPELLYIKYRYSDKFLDNEISIRGSLSDDLVIPVEYKGQSFILSAYRQTKLESSLTIDIYGMNTQSKLGTSECARKYIFKKHY